MVSYDLLQSVRFPPPDQTGDISEPSFAVRTKVIVSRSPKTRNHQIGDTAHIGTCGRRTERRQSSGRYLLEGLSQAASTSARNLGIG